jgi:hypothetical protein
MSTFSLYFDFCQIYPLIQKFDIMKKTFTLCCTILMVIGQLLVFHCETFAVTASPAPVHYTQPDGSMLTLYVKGDEFIHWAETTM